MIQKVNNYVYENDPIKRSEIREQFGREGLKTIADLMDSDFVFKDDKNDVFWGKGYYEDLAE